MLVFNTTYHIEEKSKKNFLIWIEEYYIPQVLKSDLLKNPKMMKVLSNQEDSTSTYSLQWEVEDSKVLHTWYSQYGAEINKEMTSIFKDDVIGFPTLLEVVNIPKYD